MTKIVIHKLGDVKKAFVKDVLEVLNESYENLFCNPVDIVDIYFFEKSFSMNAFLNEEKRKLGIKTSSFEESFLTVHDAWHGTPRIMLAYDKMLSVPKLVSIGSLRHELAHTVLHGSIEYYLFPMPISLVKLESNGVISRQFAVDFLYLASIAVKDYEATRLLFERGYIEDQVVYNKYYLKPLKQEAETWKLVEKNRITRLLFIVSLLKTVCCATPLIKDEKHGEEIKNLIRRNINYLPPKLFTGVSKTLEEASHFGWNTHENVHLFIKRIIELEFWSHPNL